MKICIDPGHSGEPDPGAVGPTGVKESDVTLVVGLRLADKLTAAGHSVTLTRAENDPATDDLPPRVLGANSTGADIFVSIHCNAAEAPSAHGSETFYYPGSNESARLAQCIQNELAGIGLTNRGVKQETFYVLRITNMPAVLVELAFISNPEEEQLLASNDGQQALTEALYRGIQKYAGRR